MKHAAWAALILSGLMAVAAVVLFIIAIWTVGPNSERLGGTGGVLIIVAFCVGLLALLAVIP